MLVPVCCMRTAKKYFFEKHKLEWKIPIVPRRPVISRPFLTKSFKLESPDPVKAAHKTNPGWTEPVSAMSKV